MAYDEDILGAIMRRGSPQPLRCRLKRGGRGEMLAYDPSTGQSAVIEGVDGMGADDFGGDDDDDFGAESDVRGIDDELMGAEREMRELERAVDEDDDDDFGAKDDRLERRLANLKQDIEKIQNKIGRVRAKWRRNHLQKRLDEKLSDYRRVKGKLEDIRSDRRKAKKQAAAKAAAVLGVSAAGAGLGAIASGSALASREGVSPSSVNMALLDPKTAQAIRDAQTKAGQRFSAVAPPGSGRLTRLTMYQSGSTNPRNALTVPSGGITTATQLISEDIPYAEVKIVGFVTSTFGSALETACIALVEDLKIKGGSNLFLNDNPHPATNYDSANDQYAGLRSYPKLRSPNQATVNVYATGDQTDVMIITCDLVCDIIQDDVYGTGFTGPYAG